MDIASRNRTFGRQPVPHTIIIAKGDKVRHWTLRPWMLAAGTALAGLMIVGCLGTTTLFLSSERVAEALQARDARAIQAYEERIASLRAQLDRVTTRQHFDRTSVAEKVELLLDQQEELAARYGKLEPLLEQAEASGLLRNASLPVPTARPATAEAESAAAPSGETAPGVAGSLAPPVPLDKTVDLLSDPAGFGDLAGELIPRIDRSMSYVEERQLAQLESLAETAHRKVARIADLLGAEGIDLPLPIEDLGIGGPFVPPPSTGSFEESLSQLGETLDALDRLTSTTEQLPLGAPVPGARRSSTFGVRLDPFFRRKALHAGVDYAATSGTAVQASAAGKVVRAGRAGSYGLLVEIDHGNGLSSRYAHLSAVDVAKGERVEAGRRVGKVGSTGRSTGPHLHYEIRRDGDAVDPTRFLRAGQKLRAL